MIRRPPRSTLDRSSAASDVYKRQSMHRSRRYLPRLAHSVLVLLPRLYQQLPIITLPVPGTRLQSARLLLVPLLIHLLLLRASVHLLYQLMSLSMHRSHRYLPRLAHSVLVLQLLAYLLFPITILPVHGTRLRSALPLPAPLLIHLLLLQVSVQTLYQLM